VVADPGSPRWRSFRSELVPAGLTLELVSWDEVLRVDGDARRLPALQQPAVLRVDSPDSKEATARALMQLALASPRSIPGPPFEQAAVSRRYRPGEIWPPLQYHAGLVEALTRLQDSLADLPWVRPWLSPTAIIAMFDKVATRARLAAAGLPHTTGFEPASLEALLDELQTRRWRRAYLKLRYGYAGCGLVLLDLRRQRGMATVDETAGYFANTRHLRWRPLQELHDVIGFIIAQGATCERAIPLAELDGDPIDLRLVVIDGEARFAIFRQSRVPITNLHLVGRRADTQRCRQLIGRRLWADAVDASIRATALFEAPLAGVDLAIGRNRLDLAILELNAFGDFFPHLRDEGGHTVHGAVLRAVLPRTRRS
jgi:hypothetical protein